MYFYLYLINVPTHKNRMNSICKLKWMIMKINLKGKVYKMKT